MSRSVNWNKREDDFSLEYWKQNLAQFWVDEEFVPSEDKKVWETLTDKEKEVYKRVLVGLTALDTKQGGEGMPLILIHTKNLQAKAVLAFMGAMEEIHAKSYSNIFTTLLSEKEIDELFEWEDNHNLLRMKSEIISEYYLRLLKPNVSDEELYMAMVASVFLETYLFYSGFFYPLYLAGQGKMIHSAEIINLIIRDESIHGTFVGLLAQRLYDTFDVPTQNDLLYKVESLLVELLLIETKYAEEIYYEVGLDEEVKKFIRYNGNKAMNNLGFDNYFKEEEINPIVENGLKVGTKNHDFFSVKGNSYFKATKVEAVSDDVFDF